MDTRLKLVRVVVLLTFVALLWRLSVLQITRHEQYANASSSQATVEASPTTTRGNIFFSNKDERVIAATEKDFYTLAINPKKITDKEAVYEHLSQFVTLEREDFDRRAARTFDPFEILAKRITSAQRDEILVNAPVGIEFLADRLRYYPGGSTAAHVLGFIGGDERGETGKYGVEQYYNDRLATNLSSDADGPTFLELLRTSLQYDAGGGDIVLTVDIGVQKKIERTLAKTLEKWQATRGGIIVVDPKTGGILGMAGTPTFDPNTYYDTDSISAFTNPNIQYRFELGSIVKPLTMAAAIDSGAVTEQDTYYDAGYIMSDGFRIENFDGKGRGTVPIQQILSQSLNTGVVHLMREIGRETFGEYLMKFGLGEQTDIDLFGEVPGNIANLNPRREVEYATAAFGQGISITPIGLTMALSAIANGGELVRPHVVDKFIAASGEVIQVRPEKKHRVIREESALVVQRMLVTVVDEALANGNATIPGYTMGAKTGTAQIASSEERGYGGEFLHSFFGFAPGFDARFLVLLYVERPVGARYASQTLTEPYSEIMEFLLAYYNVPPDRL